MTTPAERWLLDTNVWVFGLRRDADFPACAALLDQIGSLSIIIPLQVLKELAVNLQTCLQEWLVLPKPCNECHSE